MKNVSQKKSLLSHQDTHLPDPAVSSHSIKMKAMQFQTGFHCPEYLLQWCSNLQPAWLLIKPYKLKEKEQRTEVWLGLGVHLSVDTFQILAPGNGSWSIQGDSLWGLLLEKQKTLFMSLGPFLHLCLICMGKIPKASSLWTVKKFKKGQKQDKTK